MKKSLILIILTILAVAGALFLAVYGGVFADDAEEPAETITPSDEPSAEPSPEPTPEPTEQVLTGPFYVKVNLECNTVTVYSVADNGDMTPVKAMVCSTGSATPTSGKYDITYQGKWEWLGLFGDVYGHYATQITGNILFHSVPYLENGNPASLEYWEFDQLGTACSMGCVRLQVIDAKWVYDHKEEISCVEFYSDSDPGPLGKPTSPIIGDNEECRDWDPTDPDPNNPWNK